MSVIENRTERSQNATFDSGYFNGSESSGSYDSEDYSLPPYIIISLILSVLSIVLNMLSLLAIFNSPRRLTTQLRLAASLIMADLVIAFSVLLHTMFRTFSRPTYLAASSPQDRILSSCTLVFNFALNVTGHLVCLFNLVVMGLDHYVAVFRPLRYPSIVTRRRTIYGIITIWAVSLLCGYSMFFSALSTYKQFRQIMNYCDVVMHNDYHSEYLVFAAAIVCIFIMIFTYMSVFCEVQRIKRRGSTNDRERHNKKTMWTTLLILGTFALFWLPSCLYQVILVILVVRDPKTVLRSFPVLIRTGQYLYCLMLCNCLADPVIYAIRVRDVQLGYRMMYLKLCFAWRKHCRSKSPGDELYTEYVLRSRCLHEIFFPPLLMLGYTDQAEQNTIDDRESHV